MLKFQSLGYFTDNELLAMKKNISEDTKLREKIWSMSLQLDFSTNSHENKIKCVRKDLKEICRSTGCSPRGIPTLRTADRRDFVRNCFSEEGIPTRILDRIQSSNNGQSASIYNEKEKIKIFSHIRAVSTAIGNKEMHTEKDRRKIKSEGGVSKTLLSIDDFQTKSTFPREKLDTPLSLEDDVFENTGKELNAVKVTPCAKDPHEDNKRQNNTMETHSIHSFQNQWNVHNRKGKTIDPLELPRIKDCYRPMCRPNCSTCLLRKMKAPCFLVPGVNVSQDHFELEQVPVGINNTNEKVTKNKRNVNEHCGHDFSDGKGVNSDNDEMRPEVIIKETKQSETSKFIAECLEMRKNRTEKCISKTKLKELSSPKQGFRKELRFSKTFIKQGLEKMKKFDSALALSAAERRRQNKVQGQIAIFFATLNEKRNQTIKPINEILDFPILEEHNSDFSHLHQPISLPTIEITRSKRERRVCFK